MPHLASVFHVLVVNAVLADVDEAQHGNNAPYRRRVVEQERFARNDVDSLARRVAVVIQDALHHLVAMVARVDQNTDFAPIVALVQLEQIAWQHLEDIDFVARVRRSGSGRLDHGVLQEALVITQVQAHIARHLLAVDVIGHSLTDILIGSLNCWKGGITLPDELKQAVVELDDAAGTAVVGRCGFPRLDLRQKDVGGKVPIHFLAEDRRVGIAEAVDGLLGITDEHIEVAVSKALV